MVLMVANLKLIEISRQINVFFFVTRVVFDFLGAGTRARWGEPHRSNQRQSDLETSLLLFSFVWRNILIKEKSSHVMVSVFFFLTSSKISMKPRITKIQTRHLLSLIISAAMN